MRCEVRLPDNDGTVGDLSRLILAELRFWVGQGLNMPAPPGGNLTLADDLTLSRMGYGAMQWT